LERWYSNKILRYCLSKILTYNKHMSGEEKDKKELRDIILASVDRSIADAKELEGKELSRGDVLKGWKEHLDLTEKS